MKFQQKRSEIEAIQWFKNGDHPLDYIDESYTAYQNGRLISIPPAHRKANNWEGDVVRYYRSTSIDGNRICDHCGCEMHDHGWIDSGGNGRVVCPGDWIISYDGKYYPCKPDVFVLMYELVG